MIIPNSILPAFKGLHSTTVHPLKNILDGRSLKRLRGYGQKQLGFFIIILLHYDLISREMIISCWHTLEDICNVKHLHGKKEKMLDGNGNP